ncbi:glycosyltransferase family 2 protein [Aquamicrobium sp. LC103]|uniref:glycosyltransferase family 2 protein n=1 Tax=Aquamicrobium sp. LC103 TaxID=1120658 RepID=UPI00063EAD27|nr:glycosyltransferase family 2 protein [Aquamicrobium sp. LC103]TKT77650.1 glycosyltransferase family 2 protein [Aquamicrobium sp. LC103]
MQSEISADLDGNSRLSATVSAVIVTYEPDLAALGRLVAAISAQVGRIIVVDNGSRNDVGSWLSRQEASVDFIALGENFGIARAQNAGIGQARAHGARHVLLFDQDSLPAADMVAHLLRAAEAKRAEGVKVAAVGPRYEDTRQMNPPPFIKVEGLRLKRHACASPDAVVEVDYLIASGSLLPMTALDAVGGMQEELFIDYVDIEWGLRAQREGFRSFGACAARMQHSLGDNPIQFRNRHIPVHSPLRHYYHFRNAVWLYRQPWPRWNWKLVDGIRLLRKFVFYSLFTPPRIEHARMMALGIAHGLTGRMGKRR